MNLYGNQRWNQVLRKGKHFLLRMWHPSWSPFCRIKEWKALMTTISWHADIISNSGHRTRPTLSGSQRYSSVQANLLSGSLHLVQPHWDLISTAFTFLTPSLTILISACATSSFLCSYQLLVSFPSLVILNTHGRTDSRFIMPSTGSTNWLVDHFFHSWSEFKHFWPPRLSLRPPDGHTWT